MPHSKPLSILLLTVLLIAAPSLAGGFERRGFYLHGSWVMNHPFAVRSWDRADFADMFHLLRRLGFNTVMIWPTPECAPMPLSEEDRENLARYRHVIDDAHAAQLECWIVYCPSVIADPSVRGKPWSERSLYAAIDTIRLDGSPRAAAYLRHRQAVIRTLDNADAFVVIDADPGGYPGAPVEEYLRILRNDQQAVPGKRIIPWIWGGWGRDHAGPTYWHTPVAPSVRPVLRALKERMREPWEMLPGRSHRSGWANGRVNVRLVDEERMMGRSTIMCYEAIEFEPTPPAATLQFDLIRQSLRTESRFADVVRGVFGNAQQPVMVLPNLYLFARGAADLDYLDTPDAQVLTDFARELGGDPAVLVPAWSCLERTLENLPTDLAADLRALELDSDFARHIPGGPKRYVEILAAQVDARRSLLEAVHQNPRDAAHAARTLADAAAALINWWQVHRYVGGGQHTDPFQWHFVRKSEVNTLREHAGRCRALGPNVATRSAELLAEITPLPLDDACRLINGL